MTTRADIAKLAGVSESTVSYVLSGKRPISEATKKRVLETIERAGYKSNYAAAALAGGSPRLVTMMISNLFSTPASRINGALVDGIVDGVRELGFHSVIWPVSNDDDADVELLIQSNFSGGVILMNVKEKDKRVQILQKHKIPFFVLGRTEVNFKYNYVDRDFSEVDKKALTKLKELGHTEIGIMISNYSMPDRIKNQAKDLKLNLHEFDIPNTLEGGQELAANFTKKYPKVTAIVSYLDAASIGFVNSAAQYNLTIPEDLSFIGVNMLESQAESTHPAISTVAYDAYEMAKSCGIAMVKSIEAGKQNKQKFTELWVGEFVDRGSTSKKK